MSGCSRESHASRESSLCHGEQLLFSCVRSKVIVCHAVKLSQDPPYYCRNLKSNTCTFWVPLVTMATKSGDLIAGFLIVG